MNILKGMFKNSSGDRIKEKHEITSFIEKINSLFKSNKYIAKSDYKKIIDEFKMTYNDLVILNSKDILLEYCLKNKINSDDAIKALNLYENIEYFIERRNEQYINKKLVSEEEYLDNILKRVDKNIKLDLEQRKVVLSDEDYTLVIAGAGAGKTTTVAAKVKYLVEKQNVNPNEILIISFTNKAVQELKDKINKDLNIDCPITTFHSTGYAILKKDITETPIIASDKAIYFVIRDYMKDKVLKNERTVNNLLLFFSSYFNAPYTTDELKKFFNKLSIPYSTLKGELNEYRKNIINQKTKKNMTIVNEHLRSHEEVQIANFLYLNNIDYEYEPIYRYNIKEANKPYTPDFIIKQGNNEVYLEHFGISQDGKNSMYSEEELNKYKMAINNKVKLHKKHQTRLIYTFSKYNDGLSMLEHLKQELIKNGFILKPKSETEVLEKLMTNEENKYITKLVSLITRFINNYKVNGYSEDEFNKMIRSTSNVRAKLFLNICHECYLEYQKYLKENNMIDFQDMINESARLLNEAKINNQMLNFKYIIVDEYQDISKQRFDLTQALSEICTAKIIVVGDDWQSIYAFSGSDIELFTKFKEKMGYGKIIKIINTYRNSQELIDIAGDFVQKNDQQIKKELKSPKNIDDPVIIYTYDSTKKAIGANNKTGVQYNLALAVTTALEDIMSKCNNPEQEKILILTRFGFEGEHLERTGLFEFKNHGNKVKSVKYPFLDITLMTAHSSKGLGYDNVIIINGKNGTYGFPSKIEDDPVLSFVIKGDTSIDYAEERRLFYVALTRTKNRVYCIAPKENPSEFLLELKKDYQNVVLKGEWNEDVATINRKKCPLCGFPLQHRVSNIGGMSLFICTNEPEICGFMTNNLHGGKMTIQKCDKCYDGYLIVKENSKDNTFFLGCTNYVANKTGCNNYISEKTYYLKNNLEFSPKVNVEIETDNKIVTKAPKLSKDTVEIKGDINLNDNMPQIILDCINKVSEFKFFGITLYADLFKGSMQKKIIDNNLHKLPYHGLFKNFSSDYLKNVIEKLIEKEYLLQTRGLYPVLHPTFKGLNSKITTNLKNEISKKMDINAHNIAQIVLDAIICVNKKCAFTPNLYVSFLKGSKQKKIFEYELDKLPYYGICRNIDKSIIKDVMSELINKGYLFLTEMKYIKLTEKGKNTKVTDIVANNFHEKNLIS